MCVDLDKKDETEVAEIEEIDLSERNKIAFEIVEKEMCRVKEKGREAVTWLEFEELGIDDEMLRSLDLSTKFLVIYFFFFDHFFFKLINFNLYLLELSTYHSGV